MAKKAKVTIPWYERADELDRLRKECLYTIPGQWVQISFNAHPATGQFCWFKSREWIEVNPLPIRDFPVREPFCKTKSAQKKLVRALLRHEVRHFLLTTRFTAWSSSTLAFLVNVLEDQRIEGWQDPSDPDASDLFAWAGNLYWRYNWDKLKDAIAHGVHDGAAPLTLLNACLWWRWGVSRISGKKFCQVVFGDDPGAIRRWLEDIRPRCEAAWTATTTETVQARAEEILALIGLDPAQPTPADGVNPLGELAGEDQPETPRAPAPADSFSSSALPDGDARLFDGTLTGEAEKSEADDEVMVGPEEPDLVVDFDPNAAMVPADYTGLLPGAALLADRILVLPTTKTLVRAHPARGVYRFRREWRDDSRPNEWRETIVGGKKRAILVVNDSSSSNADREDQIRLALLALSLRAERDGHNLCITVTGQTSLPHYAVLQAFHATDPEACKARIAGLSCPHGQEFLGWALQDYGNNLAVQPEPVKELLVLTDAELVVPGDETRCLNWLQRVPAGIRVTGILLVENSASLTRSEGNDRAAMERLFQGHNLIVCTADELPDRLNAILLH